MNMRDPIRSVSSAMTQALTTDLLGVSSEHAAEMVHAPGRSGLRRPHAAECNVVLFTQTWEANTLGFRRANGGPMIDADTVVVVGPAGDACVYIATQLAYHVRAPNRRFFLDVAAQCMAPTAESHRYDGRDDAETESVEYSLEMEISRLHASIKAQSPEHGMLVAKLLHGYAVRFEQVRALSACES